MLSFLSRWYGVYAVKLKPGIRSLVCASRHQSSGTKLTRRAAPLGGSEHFSGCDCFLIKAIALEEEGLAPVLA